MEVSQVQAPLQIYLDSSDYSNLATDLYADDLKFLLGLSITKKVVFRYSSITITELIHTDKKYQIRAVQRARVLKQLCGANAFVHHSELLFKDCCVASGIVTDVFPTYAFNNSGEWFPSDVENSFINLKNEIA